MSVLIIETPSKMLDKYHLTENLTVSEIMHEW